jgi:hypothetical protein
MALTFNLTAKVKDIEKARDLVIKALNADGCKVREESSSRITATRGSQIKMRLLGGAFVNIKVLPVKLGVDFINTGQEQRVNFYAADDLEFGLMIGMETRYKQAVQDMATVGYIAVNEIMLPDDPAAQGLAPTAAFCRNCGSKLLTPTGFCGGCGTPIS